MGGRHRAREWSSRDLLVVAGALVVGVVAAGLTQDAARSTGLPRRRDGAGDRHGGALAGVADELGECGRRGAGTARPPVEVQVDGRTIGQKVALGKVLGPLRLSAGTHQVRFIGATTTAASVTVKAGAAHDVVLHAPAAAGGDPMVSVYQTPTDPIAQGKARVLLAHTAEVGAADIWVDGAKVFSKISNGQFAQADVPAGTAPGRHPTGRQHRQAGARPDPVDLAAGTVTLAYAVGDPAAEGMSVVAHVERLAADGSVTPLRIHTGSAGLATGAVRGFGSLPAERAWRGPVNLSHRTKLVVVVLAALVLPSILAWGVRAATSRSDGDRAQPAAERSSPTPTAGPPSESASPRQSGTPRLPVPRGRGSCRTGAASATAADLGSAGGAVVPACLAAGREGRPDAHGPPPQPRHPGQPAPRGLVARWSPAR